MKPNYKRLAEDYREKYLNAQKRISDLLHQNHLNVRCLKEKDAEIEKWKQKYSKALDKNITLQEMLGGDTND